ncbi:MarR family transcriptional regulator [Idiomarina tyrosinivorans]|uniref:MarR family transcriptional regulator n=1 Tax=Idiomarina tyrosinivorans TaxID=1445662 RepID=A0A432ZUJ8_9GAMM|nr:MarR family transcriptional regulator [Idiomarina tyrosinivorans]RUO81531.1 MarR family transcriptional regulator [Idiomarina tyrosinivorans]
MNEFSPDRELMFMLSDVARLIKRDFDQRAQTLGLTRAQWSILSRLNRCQGVKQSELAELLEIKPITLARHIDRLQQGGWVERRADPCDRRAWRLHLTDQVEPVLEKLRALGEQTRNIALAGVDDGSRQTILQALKTIKQNLAD